MTVAGLAATAGVGVETVRYYQRRGLMTEPARPAGDGLTAGVRRYGDADGRRLRFIRSAQGAGFTLNQIAELLALDAGHDHARARDLARQRIAALDAEIEKLSIARQALNHLARECEEAGNAPCPIINSFDSFKTSG